MSVSYMTHPLIKHKITLLRKTSTGTNEFRKLIEEIAMLMGYEAIGLYRDPETHLPHEYYCKLPEAIDERQIVVVDPMLATGGSAVAAVDFIKARGGRKIKFMSVIAAPEGVSTLMKAHPDIQLYVGCLDRCLNENAYICPGLGDAGDRIFGTQ